MSSVTNYDASFTRARYQDLSPQTAAPVPVENRQQVDQEVGVTQPTDDGLLMLATPRSRRGSPSPSDHGYDDILASSSDSSDSASHGDSGQVRYSDRSRSTTWRSDNSLSTARDRARKDTAQDISVASGDTSRYWSIDSDNRRLLDTNSHAMGAWYDTLSNQSVSRGVSSNGDECTPLSRGKATSTDKSTSRYSKLGYRGVKPEGSGVTRNDDGRDVIKDYSVNMHLQFRGNVVHFMENGNELKTQTLQETFGDTLNYDLPLDAVVSYGSHRILCNQYRREKPSFYQTNYFLRIFQGLRVFKFYFMRNKFQLDKREFLGEVLPAIRMGDTIRKIRGYTVTTKGGDHCKLIKSSHFEDTETAKWRSVVINCRITDGVAFKNVHLKNDIVFY